MIFPVISLIGRKNVGKSTLFNRLTSTNDALISADCSGLTRDRRYGSFRWRNYQSIIIDTGGIEVVKHEMDSFVFNQTVSAVLEANLILFIVDGKVGLQPCERDIVNYLYRFRRSMFVVVNKMDNSVIEDTRFEFYALGVKKIFFISALHGFGIDSLSEEIFLKFFHKKLISKNIVFDKHAQLIMLLKNPSYFLRGQGSDIIRLAIVGAPNVGKSTFINFVVGENRVVVSQSPGTTRDSVCVSMIYRGYKWIIVDTAGMRKKNKISSSIEEISVMNTLKVIQSVTVVLLLINAYRGISAYDLSLLNNILRSGKSLVVGINKWDLLSNSSQKEFKIMCNVRMNFIPFIAKNYVSSLSGYGIYRLLQSIMEAHRSSFKNVSTSCLTDVMRVSVNKCPPPRVYGKQVKLKYAHIGGHVPFIIVVHGTYVTGLPNHYKRYLVNCFSNALKVSGLSICIQFKEETR